MSRDPIPPVQERARATLERILDATEALLEERVLDEIPVAEIMARAGMAVGTFYRRFPTKEALLPYLYARYDRRLREEQGAWLDPAAWAGLDLRARIARMAALAVATYRARRGLWRAVMVHAVAHPEAIDEEQHRARRRLVRSLARVLAERADEIRHPDPGLAAELGVVALMAVCKDKILLETPGRAQSRRLSDRRLARELEVLLAGYLGLEARAR